MGSFITTLQSPAGPKNEFLLARPAAQKLDSGSAQQGPEIGPAGPKTQSSFWTAKWGLAALENLDRVLSPARPFGKAMEPPFAVQNLDRVFGPAGPISGPCSAEPRSSFWAAGRSKTNSFLVGTRGVLKCRKK